MKSSQTSYAQLFERAFVDGVQVARIEIPLLQRDYAQGRQDARTSRIRAAFLDSLLKAARGGPTLSLDFVYGDIQGDTLFPLDGQQRLTTLFLLHWYVAARSGHLQPSQPWLQLGYSTRASARLFCERLASATPDFQQDSPSRWLVDQPWFQAGWEADPTVQSMLVVLDDLHHELARDDAERVWSRLVDKTSPAITFHVLPLKGMGLGDEIYIRMNSRGKPLTEFELFKARFERLLEARAPEAARKFAHRIDDQWIDAFWRPGTRDGDMDASLLRYIRFLTDLCIWRAGRDANAREDLESTAQRVYSGEDNALAHIDFLIRGFDTWIGEEPLKWFETWFVSQHADNAGGAGLESPLRLFRPLERKDCNLFSACCRLYEPGVRSREFGWPELLMLYASLVHRWHRVDDAARRLRIVRNLIEGSQDELRADRMPALLADVDQVMRHGSMDAIRGFNQRISAAEERHKRDFLDSHPDLRPVVFALEDHPLLRGCLAAFNLEAATLSRHSDAFRGLFEDERRLSAITAALLASGDYGMRIRERFFDFGSSRNLGPWRVVFTGASREELTPTREALAKLLEQVASRGTASLDDVLGRVAQDFLATREQAERFDWRYYLVKYAAMRDGASGRYAGNAGQLGYSICMLDKLQMNSNYRDPYLHAARLLSGVAREILDPDFTGYESVPRWMPLRKSNIALRAVQGGFHIHFPEGLDPAMQASAEEILATHGASAHEGVWMLAIPQSAQTEGSIDTIDRVQRAAQLQKALVNAGH